MLNCFELVDQKETFINKQKIEKIDVKIENLKFNCLTSDEKHLKYHLNEVYSEDENI